MPAPDGFDDVQFPSNISWGARGGPRFKTHVIVTFSGQEQRIVNWSNARGVWDVSHGLRSEAEAAELVAFFRARRGRARSFRFKDWLDFRHSMTDPDNLTPLAFSFTGDGTSGPFQMDKVYTDAGGTYTRTITKPIAATVTIYENGSPFSATVDPDDGTFTTAAPTTGGSTLAWTGEFDVHARFDTDEMDFELEFSDFQNWRSIPVVELLS